MIWKTRQLLKIEFNPTQDLYKTSISTSCIKGQWEPQYIFVIDLFKDFETIADSLTVFLSWMQTTNFRYELLSGLKRFYFQCN